MSSQGQEFIDGMRDEIQARVNKGHITPDDGAKQVEQWKSWEAEASVGPVQ